MTAALISRYADLCFRAGWFDEALEKYTKVLTIKETLLGSHHRSVSDTYADLGKLCSRKQDHHAEAVQYFEKSIAIKESVLGPDHLDTLKTSRYLADLLSQENETV